MSLKYILMADVIESREMDARKLQKDLSLVVSHLNKRFEKNLLSPLTITLGDEFQGVVDTLENSIELIITMEEWIIGHGYPLNLRYVLFQGEIGTKINSQIAHGMIGSGLTQAREKLNSMKKGNMRFQIEIENLSKMKTLKNCLQLFEYFCEKFRTADFKMMDMFFKGLDYSQAAQKLKKDRSLIWRRYQKLSFSEYLATTELLRTLAK